jgi:CheY-like chemotaxis protein
MSNQNPVILAVDDDPINLDIIDEFTAGKGFELLTAESGEKALEILRLARNKVNVVLLDRMMPGMDGLEVLQKIKLDPALAEIPVILLTGASESSKMAEGIRAGCFYYLTKPFDRTVLNAVLSAALRDYAYRVGVQTGMQRFKKAIEEERSDTHKATLLASYHYLNNALNQFQLVLLELETKGNIDEALLQDLKTSIVKTADDMREFGHLENPTRENVQKFIKEHL